MGTVNGTALMKPFLMYETDHVFGSIINYCICFRLQSMIVIYLWVLI